MNYIYMRLRVWRHAFGLLCFAALALPISAFAHDPIIFAHGFGVPADLYEKVVPIQKLAKQHGYDLYIARTPIGGSVQERARILNDEIKRLVPTGRFHIIAHSMGGLDARLAIYKYGLGDRVISLTTISTPHHGSAVADYVMKELDAGAAKSVLVKQFLKWVDGSVQAVRDLTTDRVEHVFNAHVTDDPRVRYYSMAFYIPDPVPFHSMIPLLWLSHHIIADAGEKYNDGMVGVDSSKWGEFLGTLPGDHWSETSQLPFMGGANYNQVLDMITTNLDQRF